MRCRKWRVVAAFFFTAAGFLAVPGRLEAAPQDSGQNSQTPPGAAAPAPNKPLSPEARAYLNSFLLKGTVYDPQGFSFPGVALRVRRANEKKFHWETATNARGEFAVRVPAGADYELMVSSKGYAEQSLAVDAKSGPGAMDRLVFHMVAVQKQGKGDKK